MKTSFIRKFYCIFIFYLVTPEISLVYNKCIQTSQTLVVSSYSHLPRNLPRRTHHIVPNIAIGSIYRTVTASFQFVTCLIGVRILCLNTKPHDIALWCELCYSWHCFCRFCSWTVQVIKELILRIFKLVKSGDFTGG